VREVAESRAAVGFVDRDAEQAEVAQLAPQVGRKQVSRSIAAARGAISAAANCCTVSRSMSMVSPRWKSSER
jgi:hypothetical protein